MAKIVVRKIRNGDAAALVRDMRREDHEEMVASSGPGADIYERVQMSINASAMLRVVEIDGAVAAIMGAVPLPDYGRAGAPWLLGTNTLNRHPGVLTKVARKYCGLARTVYPIFVNAIYSESKRNIKWLERLGFTVDRTPLPLGAMGATFYRFSMGL